MTLTCFQDSAAARHADASLDRLMVSDPASSDAPRGQPSRLATLDAMRGIAAIAVLLFHLKRELVPNGYLAVDFFFLLSGFVIARTYDRRLIGGLGLAQFVKARTIRLYPLFAIGLALGLAHRVSQLLLNDPDRLSGAAVTISALFGLFMLPSPVTLRIFPLNDPGWSLFFEMAVNVFYAAVLFRAGWKALAGTVGVCGILLVAIAIWQGSLDVGVSWRNFLGGFPRVGFSFALGMVIARLHHAPARTSWIAVVPMIGLVPFLMTAVPRSGQVPLDLLTALVAGPILVWLGASYAPPEALRRFSQGLGEISYPLYIVHYPLLLMVKTAMKDVPAQAWALGFVLGTALLSWVLSEHWDKPIRKIASRLADAKDPQRVLQAPQL